MTSSSTNNVNQSINQNANQTEIDKFNALADEWWQVNGPGKLLHILNKPRLDFIKQHTTLANKNVLDLGCGGGILTEELARAGAVVTGIDAAANMIAIAKQHAEQQQLKIDYAIANAECFAQQQQNQHKFDVIVCMEMLEHVDDFNIVITSCSALLKASGITFFSTLNRTPKAYLLAILGAEYILRLLPTRTHDYRKFIKPAELQSSLNKHQLKLAELTGIKFNPLTSTATFTTDVSVNYLAFVKGINT